MEFQTLFRELTHSTEMIRVLLAGIGGEEARIKPSKSSWSILEVICHLHDEEREDFREHLDFILYRQHEKWHPIAPMAWVKLRKYNQQDFNKMKSRFFREREKSLAWLRGLRRVDWKIKYKSQYGSMSAEEMLANWVAHDNLHVRQLVELRRMHIERIAKHCNLQYAGEW
ncbi:MAG: DinB family protein [Chloroflexi bacterium]|nr:DinB family protein [Chloroflexota bacterium]